MSAALHERVRALRVRLRVRSWEYRQRRHAKGVWFRLRRVLADAEHAYALSAGTVDALTRQGFATLPQGRELEPPRSWFLADAGELPADLDLGDPIPPGLSPRILAAGGLLLVRFARDQGGQCS